MFQWLDGLPLARGYFFGREGPSLFLDYVDELWICRRKEEIQLNLCILPFYLKQAHDHRIIVIGLFYGADQDIRD